jgi:hypothetical protein
LIGKIESIMGLQLERMYVRVAPDLATSPLVTNGDFFKKEPRPPVAPIHQQLLTWITTQLRPPEPAAAGFALTSFRQAVTKNSMQVVLALATASLPPTAKAPGCYADLDIDLGGSLTDVAGFFLHMAELASGDMTDHIDLHTRLAKDRDSFVRNFLYYDVS